MGVYYMKICPKCGSFKFPPTCDWCNEERILTETTKDEYWQLSNKERNELAEHYIETLIKDTYDPEERKRREENQIPVSQRYGAIGRKAKCPTCRSTSVSKISATSKVAGAAMFGLFSKTARSQFKCNSCGYKW